MKLYDHVSGLVDILPDSLVRDLDERGREVTLTIFKSGDQSLYNSHNMG